MNLTKEQLATYREKLLEQLQNFPEDQRESMKEQVLALNDEEFEQFLVDNKMLQEKQECIFCSIVNKKIPSFQIGENKENIAILEINPLSKGHALIVPKNHATKLPESALKLGEEVSNKLSEFSPKEIKAATIEVMDHAMLEIIPIYGNEKERKKSNPEELKKIQQEFLSKPKIPEPKVEIKQEPEKPKPLTKLKGRRP